MSDARTTSAAKTPVKDMPQARSEKPGLREGRGEASFSPGAQSGRDATQAGSASAEPASEPTARPLGAQDLPTADDVVPLLQSAMRAAARNVETVMTSTNAAMRAAEDVAHTAVEYGQRNYQHISSMLRSCSEARSVADLVTIQRDHTRAMFEDFVEETTRLGSDLSKRFGEMVDAVVKQEPGLAAPNRRKAA